MKRILITGGAGFIGSHLCKYFLDAGDGVICVDNFLSGSRDNLKEFKDNKNFRLIEHDVCQPLPEIVEHIDAIFHFACPASPNPASPISYMRYPVETLMVNTLGAQRMLELAHTNMCQIIFASTSEVYGDPLVHPQPETYWGNVNPNGPRSAYDEGKRAMEALAFA
ncbi:MAG: GDP-mannose 4,6-dehydratase, partial [Microgenomates group bacterium]